MEKVRRNKRKFIIMLVIVILILYVISIKLLINVKALESAKSNEKLEIKNVEKVATVYSVSVGDGKTVPVPKGFYYVGGSINTGVIISDNEADKYDGKTDKTTHEYATKLKGNQFVWIPCTIDEYTKIDFGMQNMASWDRETNTAEETQISKYGGFINSFLKFALSSFKNFT